MEESIDVKITFKTSDGFVETLWAQSLGNAQYKVDNSPFFVYRISWNDIVEGEKAPDGSINFVRVLKKSGNRTLRVIFEAFEIESDAAQPILQKIKDLNCSYEGFAPSLISINIPSQENLANLTDYLDSSNLNWEYADPKYEDLFPND